MAEQLSLFGEPESPKAIIDRLAKDLSVKTKPRYAFAVRGEWIEGWFWGKVVQFCGGDEYQAALIFFRALDKKAQKIKVWIIKGMQEPECYARNSCKSEYDNPEAVKKWIHAVILKDNKLAS